MSPAEVWMSKTVTHRVPGSDWQPTNAYKIHLLVTKDDDGVFSAVALNLPGAGSCGDTEEQAVENAKEAVRGTLESYLTVSEEIPWKDTCDVDIPFGAEQKWILVHV